jgi:hypothetical protein
MTFRVVYHRDFDNRRFPKTFEAEIAKSGNGPILLVPKGGGTPIIRDPVNQSQKGRPYLCSSPMTLNSRLPCR